MNRVMDELPDFYRGIKEFQEYTKAASNRLNELSGAIQNFENDQFVLTSGESAVHRREKEFRILPDRTIETLDFRKKRLLTRMMQKAPFTYRYMTRQLDELVGVGRYAITLGVVDYHLEVLVTVDGQNYYLESAKMLERIVPLNMTFETGVLANPDNFILHSKFYDFSVPYPITNKFRTADANGGLARINVGFEVNTYTFDAFYPITNMFTVVGLVAEFDSDVGLSATANSNKVVYPRVGGTVAREGTN